MILVTGSARLDHYRKGGDSLQGRYHYYRLHPLSLAELGADPSPGDLDALLQFGGFPEPLLAADERLWRRWQRERLICDTDRREVDFVVVRNSKPLFAVECKVGEQSLNPAIPYFRDRTPIPDFYQVHLGQSNRLSNGVRILPFQTLCKALGLP